MATIRKDSLIKIEKIIIWRVKNPSGSQNKCSKELELAQNTVAKYWAWDSSRLAQARNEVENTTQKISKPNVKRKKAQETAPQTIKEIAEREFSVKSVAASPNNVITVKSESPAQDVQEQKVVHGELAPAIYQFAKAPSAEESTTATAVGENTHEQGLSDEELALREAEIRSRLKENQPSPAVPTEPKKTKKKFSVRDLFRRKKRPQTIEADATVVEDSDISEQEFDAKNLRDHEHGKTKSLENPYLDGGRAYRNRIEQVSKQNILVKIWVGVGALLVLGAFAANIEIANRSHFVPYVITVDSHGVAIGTGIAKPVQDNIEERVIRAALTGFISNLRTVTVDKVVLSEQQYQVYSMINMTDPSYQITNEWFTGEDPETNGKTPYERAAEEIVHVKFVSAVSVTPETLQIEWLEESRNRSGQKTAPVKAMRAMVTWYKGTPVNDLEGMQRNPFGIYVKDYSFTEIK